MNTETMPIRAEPRRKILIVMSCVFVGCLHHKFNGTFRKLIEFNSTVKRSFFDVFSLLFSQNVHGFSAVFCCLTAHQLNFGF